MEPEWEKRGLESWIVSLRGTEALRTAHTLNGVKILEPFCFESPESVVTFCLLAGGMPKPPSSTAGMLRSSVSNAACFVCGNFFGFARICAFTNDTTPPAHLNNQLQPSDTSISSFSHPIHEPSQPSVLCRFSRDGINAAGSDLKGNLQAWWGSSLVRKVD